MTKDIIAQASKGDIDAFQCIYSTYANFVYNVAFRIVGNSENAEEVCQDVFVKVYQKLSSFESQASLRTWIYKTTVNTAIDYVRKFSKKSNMTVELNENVSSLTSHSGMNEEIDTEHFEDVFQMLNPEKYKVFVEKSANSEKELWDQEGLVEVIPGVLRGAPRRLSKAIPRKRLSAKAIH